MCSSVYKHSFVVLNWSKFEHRKIQENIYVALSLKILSTQDKEGMKCSSLIKWSKAKKTLWQLYKKKKFSNSASSWHKDNIRSQVLITHFSNRIQRTSVSKLLVPRCKVLEVNYLPINEVYNSYKLSIKSQESSKNKYYYSSGDKGGSAKKMKNFAGGGNYRYTVS